MHGWNKIKIDLSYSDSQFHIYGYEFPPFRKVETNMEEGTQFM